MKRDLFIAAGLSELEANCYKQLLERGELSPPQVAEILGISRQNSYLLLAKLERLGVVTKDERHNKLRYSPANPKILTKLCALNIRDLENVKQKLDDNMTDFQSLYNLAKDRPGISVFHGVEGIKKLYRDTLHKHPSEILLVLSEHGKTSYLTAWIERNFRPQRLEKGIQLREIINTPEEHDPRELETLLWEKKYVDMPTMPRNMDILIYDDNVTFIKYNKKEPRGFTIDDSLVYFALKSFFETIWDL